MTPLRVGSVRFLNTRPLIEGLEALPALSLQPAVPSRLLTMLESAQVDLALVSLIDAARATTPLALLPVGMIGSDGPTLTVRLFSPVPPDQVREVWADTDSHTSIALCRLLLDRVYGVRPTVRDFNAREQMPLGEATASPASASDAPPHAASTASPPASRGTPTTRGPSAGAVQPGPHTAILLIGDKVVTDPPDAAAFPIVIDLGEAWKQWTGQPFVYATWMCRAADRDRPEIALAAGLLDRQRRHNLVRLEAIAQSHAPGAGWPLDQARRYLTEHLRFEIGPRERASAQRFIDECAALGLVPSTTLDWLDWRPSAKAAAALR